MNVFLTHIDWSPIIYGFALFLSVLSMAWKIKRGNYVGFCAEVLVVGLILIIHGGSVTGGFAATIAGLLSGWFIPLLMHVPTKQRTQVIEHSPRTLSDWDIYVLTRKP
jgi:uncharacterized membrane protein